MKRILHRTAIGLLMVLLGGCAATQSVVRSFVDTQKRVGYKRSEYANPAKVVGGTAVLYTPALSGSSEMQALVDHAPLVVQGLQGPDNKSYPDDSDAIGSPELKTNPEGGFTVAIDTEKPVLYATTAKTSVRGVELTQLVYVFWYPRHPVGMVEKGDIDGGVLRITLDAAGRPAVYEFVMGCGCWHGVFVGEHVERWAEGEFHEKLHNKTWCVEQTVGKEDDWKVRDLVWASDKGCRPVIFMSTGRHECLAIQTEDSVQGLSALTGKTYALGSYDALERLPVPGVPDKTASMFNSDGLVWGARRKGEEKLFSNLNHGGWPRRLNAMKVHWDEESWNDPALLAKFLRLPQKITDPKAEAAPLRN